jgi:hypothetical protein
VSCGDTITGGQGFLVTEDNDRSLLRNNVAVGAGDTVSPSGARPQR